MKMVQRFLFDRINGLTGDSAVNKSVQFTIPIFPDSAKAPFARRNSAALSAEIAVYSIIFKLLVKHRFFYHINPQLEIVFHDNNGCCFRFIHLRPRRKIFSVKSEEKITFSQEKKLLNPKEVSILLWFQHLKWHNILRIRMSIIEKRTYEIKTP
jgi:hypothetical protein